MRSHPDDADDPLIGSQLDGRYLVRRRIGQGGMGVVYEAQHIGLDRPVAIKFLLEKFTADREVLARFQLEARTASRIGHENIISILDIGEAPDGRSYIVMEYLEGADLAHVLAQSGPMHPERAVKIIRQILRGLGAAHSKGILHRDMKPENVFLVRRDDDQDFVKIMDFGISKIMDAHDSKVRLTETGAVVGTPVYMAPEQARAEQTIDQRVDVYAIGVMMFEMLCGRPPFMANAYLELVTQHLFDPPPPLRSVRPEVPPILEQVTLKALEKDPANRWSSAQELAAAIPDPSVFTGGGWDHMSTLGGSVPDLNRQPPPVVAAPTAAPEHRSTGKSKAPLWIVGGALAAAAVMVAVTVALMSGGGDAPGDHPEELESAAAPAEAEPATPAPTVASLDSVLEVDSRPQGARVIVDGDYRGDTPVTVEALRPGIHILRIEKDGWQAVETSREIEEGDTETFFAALAEAGSDEESKVTKTGSRSTGSPERRGRKTDRNPEPPETKSRPERESPANPYVDPPAKEPEPEKKPERKPERKPNPYLDKKPNPYQ